MTAREQDLAFRLARTEALRVELATFRWGIETLAYQDKDFRDAWDAARRKAGQP